MKRDGTIEAQIMNEPMTDSGGVGSDSAGQSGDTQGLSAVADAAESVEAMHAALEERIRRSDWSAGFSASYRTAQSRD